MKNDPIRLPDLKFQRKSLTDRSEDRRHIFTHQNVLGKVINLYVTSTNKVHNSPKVMKAKFKLSLTFDF